MSDNSILNESGPWTILHEGSIASRNRNEDASLNPKGIFCPAEAGHGDWEAERLSSDRYILRCRGAPTGLDDNNKVVAFINGEGRGQIEEWKISRTEDGLYVIGTTDFRLVWCAPKDDEDHAVTVRSLLPEPEIPPPGPEIPLPGPGIPPQARWKFERPSLASKPDGPD